MVPHCNLNNILYETFMEIIVVRAVGMYVYTYMFRSYSKSKIYKSVHKKCPTCISLFQLKCTKLYT